jgi:hypothetical protein
MQNIFALLSSVSYLFANALDRHFFDRFQVRKIFPLIVLEEVFAIGHLAGDCDPFTAAIIIRDGWFRQSVMVGRIFSARPRAGKS